MFKKLIPALIMLLISALLMSTATFAWFSMNKQVSADNMEITAKADNPFLLIQANGKTGDWGTTATLTAAATDLSLIHPTTINQSGMVWEYATSTDPAQPQVNNATTVKALSGTESATGATVLANNTVNYVLQQALVLKVVDDGAQGENLRVSQVVFDTGTNSIAASGRLLVVYGTSYQLFKMVNGTVTTAESGSSSALIATMTPGTSYTVDAFFYFDGTDTSAYTNNATDLTEVTAVITLTID